VRVRVEKVEAGSLGLVVTVEVRYRQAAWLKRLTIRWKWLAVDEIADSIMAERDRQSRPLEDPGRPWLPLETWE
jgi:hypothetical protein